MLATWPLISSAITGLQQPSLKLPSNAIGCMIAMSCFVKTEILNTKIQIYKKTKTKKLIIINYLSTSIFFHISSTSINIFYLLSFTFIHFHPIASPFIHFHILSNSFIHFYPITSTFIHFLPLSSTFSVYHPLSSSFNLCHPPSSISQSAESTTLL